MGQGGDRKKSGEESKTLDSAGMGCYDDRLVAKHQTPAQLRVQRAFKQAIKEGLRGKALGARVRALLAGSKRGKAVSRKRKTRTKARSRRKAVRKVRKKRTSGRKVASVRARRGIGGGSGVSSTANPRVRDRSARSVSIWEPGFVKSNPLDHSTGVSSGAFPGNQHETQTWSHAPELLVFPSFVFEREGHARYKFNNEFLGRPASGEYLIDAEAAGDPIIRQKFDGPPSVRSGRLERKYSPRYADDIQMTGS